jgi:hypothetical protein
MPDALGERNSLESPEVADSVLKTFTAMLIEQSSSGLYPDLRLENRAA